MKLTWLGTESGKTGCPTLYATDTDAYVVQGWRVLGIEHRIEIPAKLLDHLQDGTRLGTELTAGTRPGSYALEGDPVTDPAVLAQLSIPGHEAAIVVPQLLDGP